MWFTISDGSITHNKGLGVKKKALNDFKGVANSMKLKKMFGLKECLR